MWSRLAGAEPAQREALLLELIRASTAELLGLTGPEVVDPDVAFAELGFESLAAIELSRELGEATGLDLPVTLGFDHPTPAAAAAWMSAAIGGEAAPEPRAGQGRVGGGDEPVAIIGMACRFPGGVASPADLWRLLERGEDATGRFPADRGWDLDAIYDPDPDSVGRTYTERGGFLDDVAGFDAELFGIGAREALAMDPQQRLLLEASWEACERARIDPRSLAGSDTGVFVGLSTHDYYASLAGAGGELEGWIATGTSSSVASGRISYELGLQGPALTVDTACSSSSVAIHLAIRSLRQGECGMALAGGVSVIASPQSFIEFSRQKVLSPDGRCRSFAAAADGAGWAEGVGVLMLAPLAEARRQGHPVLALLRGSAVNQDGSSNGLTAPNRSAQERVIAAALADAGLRPEDIDAVEGHGTGTALGDPIEVAALLSVFGSSPAAGRPLWLGSLKSNISHAQAAAGVGGVIKVVEALRHRSLPATLHAEEATSAVDWQGGERVALLREEQPWPRGERPRRAGVSAFGISGTNAHLVVEEAPASEDAPVADAAASAPPLTGAVAWPLAAAGEEALRGQAERLESFVRERPDLDPLDLARSLAATRPQLGRRAVVVGADREGLLAGLGELAAGGEAPGLISGTAGVGRVAFLFPGQGSQWPGMARGLLAASPVFAERLDACEAALDPFVDWSLGELLRGEEGSPTLERVDVVQPALFAVMVALTALWRACGVEPDLVVGHSQGEIAAAHVAGALSLEDAARVVALRSRAIGGLAGTGGMASVALPADRLAERLERFGGRVVLAALNGPSSQAVAGEPEALDEFLAGCERDGVWARRIAVDYASHTAQIEAIREDLLGALAPIEPRASTVPMLSTVDGEIVAGESLDASYWYRNLRRPVRFEPAIASLLGDGFRGFVEVSAHPVLTVGVEEAADALGEGADAVTVTGTLRRDEGGPERFLASLAEVDVAGARADFAGIAAAGDLIDLPTYAFVRHRYWVPPAFGGASIEGAGLSGFVHPLLSAAVEVADQGGWLFGGRLSLASHPWLADHAVNGTTIVSGTVFVELAAAIGERFGCEELEELTLEAPLVVPAEGAVSLQVRVGVPTTDGRLPISIYSRRGEVAIKDRDDGPGFTRHAQGTLAAAATATEEPAWPEPGQPIDVTALYERLFDSGFGYGRLYQGLEAAWRAEGEILAEVELPAGERHGFRVHPALLDAAFHAMGEDLLDGERGGGPWLPFSWSGVKFGGAADAVRVRLRRIGEAAVSLSAVGPDGELVASVDSVIVRPLRPEQLGGGEDLFALSWKRVELPASAAKGELASLGTVVPGLEGTPSFATPAALSAALVAGGEPPAAILAPVPSSGIAPAAAAEGARWGLELIQAWLAEPGLEAVPLVFLTVAGQALTPDEEPDLAQATLWGMLRAAAAEHPGRFALLDHDGEPASVDRLAAAVAKAEPQLALRDGSAFVPRLAIAAPSRELPVFDPEGTVLITGGTGGIGAIVARHLAARHGVGHLLLVSRRGPGAPGVQELQDELAALGAEATVRACDVTSRDELATLLSELPDDRPLTAVVHSAGVLDDGLIESLTPARLETVMRPKVDAAQALDELTQDAGLAAFVLFSSVAATCGSAGQANYAAGNAYLDALAARRRARGLPAISIAWGLWGTDSDMVGGAEERGRLERAGLTPILAQPGMALLDRAFGLDLPFAVASPFDRRRLRQVAAEGELPVVLVDLVPATARTRGRESSDFARRLVALPASERDGMVLEVVRANAASVLGRSSPAEVRPDLTFSELGMDSLGALEFRNRLAAEIGLRIPATLAFDYPTLGAVVAYLRAKVEDTGSRPSTRGVRHADDEPIAIVGIGCRYPGGIASPDDFWRLLREGRDAIGPFPADRGWELDRLFHPDPDHPGTTYTCEGGFVDGCLDFDAGFFGISPREALAMDPQQRLLLEVAWEAFEHARIDPTPLRGSATGVFVGLMYQNYGPLLHRVPPELEGYLGTGTAGSVASGRIAYSFGFEGPAITVDTACSASLVSLHMACAALRSGECEMALAGGATLMTSPGIFLEFSRQRGVARDGRCKSFSADADGTGWSEGAGLILVERLADARRHGHRVLAVVKGSAVNQDGASNGLTAPNGPAQERVIRQALANAGVEPSDVDAVEAHGTGTMLGDPIEAEAIHAVYGAEHEPGRPILIGAVKSNIAHSQAAAGIAGVIKMTLALEHELLPRTLHAAKPSPKVDWSAGGVAILEEAEPWPRGERPRRAGVSSFGVSGTNAHIILEEPPPLPRAAGERDPGPVPFLLTARDRSALSAAAAGLAERLELDPGWEPADVARSLAATRATLPERGCIVGSTREGLLVGLRSLAAGEEGPSLHLGTAAGGGLAFLFSGQGRQRVGMGRELSAIPAFAAALEEVCAAFDPNLEAPLLGTIMAEQGAAGEAALRRTELAQPALFALEVALFRLLAGWGIVPDLLIGHSIGELAAAHVAGVFSLADAARLVAARGRSMGALPDGGAMFAVEATEEEAREALVGCERELALAAVNGPRAVTIAGGEAAAAAWAAEWEARGRRTGRLRVSHAFHSPLIEPCLDDLAEVAAGIEVTPPKLPIVSLRDGERISPETFADPAHWVRQARDPVEFAAAIAAARADGIAHFLELGPDAALAALAHQCFAAEPAPEPNAPRPRAAAALRGERPERAALVGALGELAAAGAAIDLAPMIGPGELVDLPTYPFRRRRYFWEPAPSSGDVGAVGLESVEHPFIGTAMSIAGEDGWLFSGRLSLSTHPWLADRARAGRPLAGIATAADLALCAARRLGLDEVAELRLEAPFALAAERPLLIQLRVGARADGRRPFGIYARFEGSPEGEERWLRHAGGALAVAAGERGAEPASGAWPPPGRPDGVEEGRAERERLGEWRGPGFRALRGAWRGGGNTSCHNS